MVTQGGTGRSAGSPFLVGRIFVCLFLLPYNGTVGQGRELPTEREEVGAGREEDSHHSSPSEVAQHVRGYARSRPSPP